MNLHGSQFRFYENMAFRTGGFNQPVRLKVNILSAQKRKRLSEFISESPRRQSVILGSGFCLKLIFIVWEMLKPVQQDSCFLGFCFSRIARLKPPIRYSMIVNNFVNSYVVLHFNDEHRM